MENKMDPKIRADIQSSTFYYFLIASSLTTIAQISTMMVIVFADISGVENVVAASVIGPTLIGAFGVIRILSNMHYLVQDMDAETKATTYGAGVSEIPFSILKFAFAGIFVVIAIVQLTTIY
jgi:hypothetical protein